MKTRKKTSLGVRFLPEYSQALCGDGDGEVYQGESPGGAGKISQGNVNFSIDHHIYWNWTNIKKKHELGGDWDRKLT